MKQFIVSARKYRPRLFEEVKGQSHVTITLRNQLREKTIPQVVLFCGPRGTGKTSCGRIFAKAINCEDLQASGEPCNVCTSCQQFQHKTSLNIHELDAAPHNSADDARQLLEQVRFHTISGKKVFIIDEVHMLSNAAFNVLLKTLEEPPAHVIFILATTEKHKIIPTTLSRCQVFDFLPIPPQDIFEQLLHIATTEGVDVEEEGLRLISEHAEGSLREALHAFDKIAAFGGGKAITKEGVLGHLHILNDTYYFKLTEQFAERTVGEALQTYDEILRLGFESHHFLQGLTKHFRHLMVAKTNTNLLQMASSMVARYMGQATQLKIDFLFQALAVVEQCELHYKERKDKRLHVELTLIKLARLGTLPSARAEGEPLQGPTSPPKETTEEGMPTTQKSVSQPVKKETLPPPKAPEETTEEGMPTTQKSVSQPIKKESLPPPKTPVQEMQQADTPITMGKVKEAWAVYMERLKAKGAMSAYATLKSPLHLEGNTVVLQIANALRKNTLHAHAHDLLAFMQHSLKNSSLRIVTRVVTLPGEVPKNGTPPEKMQHLVKKNPLVEALRKGLELS